LVDDGADSISHREVGGTEALHGSAQIRISKVANSEARWHRLNHMRLLAGAVGVGLLLLGCTPSHGMHPREATVSGKLEAFGSIVPRPIPGSVTLRSTHGSVRVTVNTDRGGSFIASVVPGRYTVTGQSAKLHWTRGSCTALGTVTVTVAGTSGITVRCFGE
jgi:hypothetical protein